VWLNRARSNLVRARTVLPAVYLEDLCFDAQQAVEKAIKVVPIARGVDFPLSHDEGDVKARANGLLTLGCSCMWSLPHTSTSLDGCTYTTIRPQPLWKVTARV
jgi:hypothetical protein